MPHTSERALSNRWTLALCTMALVAASLFLGGLIVDDMLLRLACKPWPHIALFAVLLSRPKSPQSARVALGLMLCMLGDWALEFRASRVVFLSGVLLFMLGHVAFILAFLASSKRLFPERAVPFALWGAIIFLMILPGASAKGMSIPVLLYVLAVCTMMWRASACIETLERTEWRAWAGLLGAVLFALGDMLIALDRYRSPISGVRFPIILTYWPALVLLTLSVPPKPEESAS